MERWQKVRVLHIAQSAGGVDRYIRMLLKYLDKEKFENVFICSYDFKIDDYEGLAAYLEQVDMHREIGTNDIKAISVVRKLIKKYTPDIVYAHSSKAGVIARVADIGLNNLCVYNPHGWAFNMHCSKIKQILYMLIERVAAPFCNKFICISEAEKLSGLSKKIYKSNKAKVIYNGVDIDAYENEIHQQISRLDINIPEDAFVVGMVGRISPQKAPDIFIKAAKIIKENISNAYFLIVGDGEQEKEIREYAKENGLTNSLYITGWVDNPLSYVELFDVAMLLSRWEGFGLALPEYMMTGKPIVATKVDAIPDIISDEYNGLLVEADDIEGVYMAVRRLHEDVFLRKRLIDTGIKDVHERFDVRRVAKEHEKVFVELLS